MMRYRLLSPLFLSGLLALAPSLAAAASVVRGTVILPEDLKSGRRFLGHWRVENTTVPVQVAPARGDTVVVLVGPRAPILTPRNTPVEIAGMQANPSTVVVGEGAVVEFRNSDKVSHDLSIPGHPEIMPPERLSPGTVRKQRFGISGEYVVHCTEYPHVAISVIVTSSPFFAAVDETGGFKLPDVPEGPATLKVWSNGRWVHEQAIEVTPKGVDLTIKVSGTGNIAVTAAFAAPRPADRKVSGTGNIAVTAAFAAPRPADRIEQLEGQRLDVAQYAAEQMLKLDAHRWIDAVAKLGCDRHLREALDSSSRGAGEPKALYETVRSRLKALVPDPAAFGVESLIAVDSKGRVVAWVGDDEGEYGESIAGAEVVGDALRGYLSDDVWGAGGRLRRMAAAPVISRTRERIVGAVVVAVDTGKRLSEIWKRNLGVDVAIVIGNNVVSSTLPEALLGQLPKLIEQHATEIANHKRSRAFVLHMGNERMLLVAAPFVGEASEQRAYYVLLNKQSNSAGRESKRN